MADILIAEDEDVLRRNLTFILNSAGYSAVPARSTIDAIELLKKRHFDVVITDLVMPRKGGGEIITYVSERCPDTAVIVITAYPSTNTAIDAVRKGVIDYFTKPFRTEDILEAVKSAIERKRSKRALNWEVLSNFDITRREEEILRLIIEDGLAGNQEIADRLSLKVTTVKQHFENLFGKFNVKSRALLIAAVMKTLQK